jgi:hypothetical protein
MNGLGHFLVSSCSVIPGRCDSIEPGISTLSCHFEIPDSALTGCPG